VNTFASSGEIRATAVRSLLAKLEDAKRLISAGDRPAALQKLTDFKNHVAAQTGQSISPSAAQLLIADADFVIATL